MRNSSTTYDGCLFKQLTDICPTYQLTSGLFSRSKNLTRALHEAGCIFLPAPFRLLRSLKNFPAASISNNQSDYLTITQLRNLYQSFYSNTRQMSKGVGFPRCFFKQIQQSRSQRVQRVIRESSSDKNMRKFQAGGVIDI